VTLADEGIDTVLDYPCSVGHHREIYFLWRPVLRDPKDDMVLEVAVESSCEFVIQGTSFEEQNLGSELMAWMSSWFRTPC